MIWFERVQRSLLILSVTVSTVLLIRFAVDFSALNWIIAVPFWILLACSVWVGVSAALSSWPRKTLFAPARRSTWLMLIGAIPVGLLASSLDCTGLSVYGCTGFCTFVKIGLIPMIAVVSVFSCLTRSRVALILVTALSVVPLYPHCICNNAANAWWIERFGASPECYAWGSLVSAIAVGGIVRGGTLKAPIAVCWTIIAGAAGFFVGHHYFAFPW